MPHRPVRSLSRGLTLIRELNMDGPSSVQQLAERTKLNRTTCYRLLQSLQQDGFVTYDEESAYFALTAQVRMLSEGVSTRDLSSQAALPPMFSLLKEISWPSDFAVFDLGSMVVHESTHSFSSFSIHRSMVGRRRSLVRSSLGRATLEAASPRVRREMLEICGAFVPQDAELAKDRDFIAHVMTRTQNDGYASSVEGTEKGISGISVPIRGPEPVLGALNIVFFASAMTPQVAAERYLGRMKQAARDIETRWLNGMDKRGAPA
jgi:IclR family mhp operon transcriptional activator